jgi:hypothetical protein
MKFESEIWYSDCIKYENQTYKPNFIWKKD